MPRSARNLLSVEAVLSGWLAAPYRSLAFPNAVKCESELKAAHLFR